MGAFSIPAQVKTPVPDSPLQTIGGLMQLRASLTEQALRQAQIATQQQQQQLVQAEAQQKQRDLADQNTIQEAQKDPQMARAFGEGDFSALAGKIQPKTLDQVTANNLTHQTTAATLSKEKLDENAKKHDVVEQGLTGLMGLDDAAAVAAYPALKSQLEADKVVPSGILPQTIQSKDDITALAAKNGYLAGVNSKAAALKETQAKTAQAEAAASEATAKAGQAGAEQKKTEQTIAGETPIQPAEAARLAQEQAQLAETSRHNLAAEASQKLEAQAAQTRATVEAKKFTAEFGGDAIAGWAKTIEQNPDAEASIPAALRTAVQQKFMQNTGLPFPKALTGQALDQERAARNSLSIVDEINSDLKNPEIQSRLGPILGRLGNVEQRVGTAVGLSPEAEAAAQRLRTNMRYMVFQEGKALFGARVPQNLMKQLEESSPSVSMDAGTLNGAIAGVKDAAGRALKTADQQRFGGQSRSDEALGIPTVPQAPIHLKDGRILVPHDKKAADAFRKDHPDLIAQ